MKTLVERITNATVSIQTQDADGLPLAVGSGFFLGADSHVVVTNLHVLKWAKNATIRTLADGLTHKVAQVYAALPERDLCFLLIGDVKYNGLRLPVPFDIKVGDAVVVAGNPKGLEGSFSKGIVSALRDSVDLIQIDAAISPGSSGGPVVNQNGRVIAVVVSSIVDAQNVNFAVPLRLPKQYPEPNIWVSTAGVLALSSTEIDHLFGRCKVVETRRAEVKSYMQGKRRAFRESPPVLMELKHYDENGMLLLSKNFTFSGKTSWEARYSWNEKRILRTWVASLGGEGPLPADGPEFSRGDGIHKRLLNVHLGETSLYGSKNGDTKIIQGDKTYDFSSIKYDSFGNPVEYEERETASQELTSRVCRYDSSRRVIEEQRFENGKPKWRSTFTYEVDSVGNWTKRTERLDPLDIEPYIDEVLYREIQYY